MSHDNDLEYNEDITIKRYPQVPHFWSIYFSVTIEEDGKVVNCLIPREVVEDHFHNDLVEFDQRSMAKIEELMDKEILPVVYKVIKQDRTREKNKGRGLYQEVELNEDDFLGKDFRK